MCEKFVIIFQTVFEIFTKKMYSVSIPEGKSSGPEDFYSEFLKIMDEKAMKWVTLIVNSIYQIKKTPQQWLKSTYITSPIIHIRLYRKCEILMTNTLFGSYEALFAIQVIFQ